MPNVSKNFVEALPDSDIEQVQDDSKANKAEPDYQNKDDSKTFADGQVKLFAQSMKAEPDHQNKVAFPALLDGQGKLYIHTPFNNTYTIYPSVEAYNKRNCFPQFKKTESIDTSNFQPIDINLKTLSILS